MDQVTSRVERMVMRHPDYVRMYTVVGRSGGFGMPSDEVNHANIRALFKPKGQRGKSIWEIQDDLRRELRDIAGLKAILTDIAWAEGAGEYPVNLYIRGEDLTTLTKLSEDTLTRVRHTPGTVDVDTSLEFGKPEVRIALSRDLAANAAVGVGAVARGPARRRRRKCRATTATGATSTTSGSGCDPRTATRRRSWKTCSSHGAGRPR
jgi:HAE1 family hydrophobic/amphiphilic exporter-1